jgi:hypothetical protein
MVTSASRAGRAKLPRVMAGKNHGLSTRITSAPRSDSNMVAYGPDHTSVMSSTLIPANGS